MQIAMVAGIAGIRRKDGFDGAAVGVTANDDVADVEDFDGVFDSGGNAAWHLALRRNDVAHGAAEEHVAGLGLEDQVGNDARVGAGDEEDVGLLAVGEKVKLILPLREDVAAEAGIALEETFHQGSVYGRLRNSKAGQEEIFVGGQNFLPHSGLWQHASDFYGPGHG